MNKVSLESLFPGMIVGQPVVSSDHRVLLEKSTRLSQAQINSLANWGINFVSIEGNVAGLLEKPVGAMASFLDEYRQVNDIVRDTFEYIRVFNEVPILQMEELAEQRLSLMVETVGALDYLYKIRCYSDHSFQHSLNVAIIAGIFGKWNGYKGEELKNLILAGLLHDIGKLFVPQEILNKPGRLSTEEMERVKEHPHLGYRLIQDLPDSVKSGVLHHHERLDGSGYPFGLAEVEIHDYARIIAVADVYEAMTADRPYRAGLMPLEALESIANQMHGKLHTGVCMTFLNFMKDYFTGNDVLLSNGEKAKIVFVNAADHCWTKPVVSTTDGKLLDLQEEKISIVNLFTE